MDVVSAAALGEEPTPFRANGRPALLPPEAR